MKRVINNTDLDVKCKCGSHCGANYYQSYGQDLCTKCASEKIQIILSHIQDELNGRFEAEKLAVDKFYSIKDLVLYEIGY